MESVRARMRRIRRGMKTISVIVLFFAEGTQYSVLGTHDSVLGTRYSVLSTRHSVLGTQTRVLGTEYSVLSTRYSVLSTRYAFSPPWSRGRRESRAQSNRRWRRMSIGLTTPTRARSSS